MSYPVICQLFGSSDQLFQHDGLSITAGVAASNVICPQGVITILGIPASDSDMESLITNRLSCRRAFFPRGWKDASIWKNFENFLKKCVKMRRSIRYIIWIRLCLMPVNTEIWSAISAFTENMHSWNEKGARHGGKPFPLGNYRVWRGWERWNNHFIIWN